MASETEHIEIAKRHKRFLSFILGAVTHYPDKCDPVIFCTWVTVAAYYRTIHLIEAVFAKYGENHVIREHEANSRRVGTLKRLAAKHNEPKLVQIREDYTTLRRLAMHAKYFPDHEEGFAYNIITDLNATQNWVIDQYLARIEHATAGVLGVAPDDLN